MKKTTRPQPSQQYSRRKRFTASLSSEFQRKLTKILHGWLNSHLFFKTTSWFQTQRTPWKEYYLHICTKSREHLVLVTRQPSRWSPKSCRISSRKKPRIWVCWQPYIIWHTLTVICDLNTRLTPRTRGASFSIFHIRTYDPLKVQYKPPHTVHLHIVISIYTSDHFLCHCNVHLT